MAWDEKKYGLPSDADAIAALESIENTARIDRRKNYVSAFLGALILIIAGLFSWIAITAAIRKSDCSSYCEIQGYPGSLISRGKYQSADQTRCLCLSESNQVSLVRKLWLESNQ